MEVYDISGAARRFFSLVSVDFEFPSGFDSHTHQIDSGTSTSARSGSW